MRLHLRWFGHEERTDSRYIGDVEYGGSRQDEKEEDHREGSCRNNCRGLVCQSRILGKGGNGGSGSL